MSSDNRYTTIRSLKIIKGGSHIVFTNIQKYRDKSVNSVNDFIIRLIARNDFFCQNIHMRKILKNLFFVMRMKPFVFIVRNQFVRNKNFPRK